MGQTSTTGDDDDHSSRFSSNQNFSQSYNSSHNNEASDEFSTHHSGQAGGQPAQGARPSAPTSESSMLGAHSANKLPSYGSTAKTTTTKSTTTSSGKRNSEVARRAERRRSSKDLAKFATLVPGRRAPDSRSPEADEEAECGGGRGVGVADIIGSFGWFQLLVLIFSGLREGLVGYDALVMSVILQPETRFLCSEQLQARHAALWRERDTFIVAHKHRGQYANLSALLEAGLVQERELSNETAQCSLAQPSASASAWGAYASSLRGAELHEHKQAASCHTWLFSNETLDSSGPSLVAEWSLVCQYHWLVAFIESAYFFGLVTGNLVWGFYADKLGRRPAYLAAHTIALVFGSLAVVAPTISTFAVCRFLSAFGSIGYNIIYSIQVELIGVEHRSFSTILNHLGWGLGVICVPLVDHLFDDYRPIIAVAPVFTLLMFPWAFWLPESSRWLMANERFKEARRELLRAANFNGKPASPGLEKKISMLEQQVRFNKLRQLNKLNPGDKPLAAGQESNYLQNQLQQNGNHQLASNGAKKACDRASNKNAAMTKDMTKNGQSNKQARSYTLIFTDKRLLKDTLILSYSAFVGHLFYYLQTINFAYVKNLSTAANFITSGAGEWVSVVVGAVLLKFYTRKTCMSLFLFIMTCSFTFQSFIDSGLMPELDTTTIITANNGIGTLASLLLVFITLIVNQEVYPTVVRQTGTSLTNTLGESGSTLAPLIIQFSRLVGSWRANIIYSILCFVGMIITQFVTKTDDIELPDT